MFRAEILDQEFCLLPLPNFTYFLENAELFCSGCLEIREYLPFTWKFGNLKSNFRNLELELLQTWNASPGHLALLDGWPQSWLRGCLRNWLAEANCKLRARHSARSDGPFSVVSTPIAL